MIKQRKTPPFHQTTEQPESMDGAFHAIWFLMCGTVSIWNLKIPHVVVVVIVVETAVRDIPW